MTQPALILTPVLGFFYYIHLSHLPFRYLAPLLLASVGVTAPLLHLIWIRVSRQTGREKRPYAELLFAFALLILVIVTDFSGDNLTLPLTLLVFFLWLVWQVQRRTMAYFYTGFSGLLLFVMILYSYRLLTEAEGFLIRKEISSRIESATEQIVHWDTLPGGVYRMSRSGKPLLSVTLPQDLFFHKPDPKAVLNQGALNPVPGRELGRISASASTPLVFPFVILYELEPGIRFSPEEFQEEFGMILGYGENRAFLSELRPEGESILEPPLSSLKWKGMFWSYRDRATSRRVRMGIYVLQSNERINLALVVQDPVVRGFRHHPLLLELFRNIRILPE